MDDIRPQEATASREGDDQPALKVPVLVLEAELVPCAVISPVAVEVLDAQDREPTRRGNEHDDPVFEVQPVQRGRVVVRLEDSSGVESAPGPLQDSKEGAHHFGSLTGAGGEPLLGRWV